MISNGEGRKVKSKKRRLCHYIALKILPALLRDDFYCTNCLRCFRTKSKLESHEKVYENKNFYNLIMPSEDTNILEFDQYKKSDKAPFIIYADLECIKIDGCKNNPENLSTTKVSKDIPSGFSMSTIFLFRSIENNNFVYRGKDCKKKFYEFLREHTLKIINLKKKRMKLLTKEQQESYENAEICYFCQEKFENKYLTDKKCCKVRDDCHYLGKYRDATHSICNLKYIVLEKIPIVFHNGPNYDCHFIIKGLAEEFKKQCTCLGEKTEKYINFAVPIEKKVTKIDKNGEKITKNQS